MVYLPSLSGEATLSDIFSAYPATSEPLLRYCEALLRGESPLTMAQRELIAAYVSGLNRCAHCTGVHSGAAEALGVTEDLVADLLRDIETAAVEAPMKAILRYARKLTLAPSEIGKADADAVYAAGWDEKALHDAVSVCALFNCFNRFVTGLGLEVTPETAKMRGKMLSKIGYAGLIEKLGLGQKASAA